MTANARLGDPITCGDVIAQGSGNCFINGMPVARVGDLTAGHCYPPVPLLVGAPTVFCNNRLVAMVSNPIPTHSCRDSSHSGTVSVGSPNCFVLDTSNTSQKGSLIVKQYIQPNVLEVVAAAQHDDDQGSDPVYTAFRRKVDENLPPTPPPKVVEQKMPTPPSVANIPTNCDDIYALNGVFSPSFQLSTNFTLAMLTTATLVSRYQLKAQVGLSTSDIVCNLRQLCVNVLEPLYARFGTNMVINSGFRHGSDKSQHYRGQAVDISFKDINSSQEEWERAQLLITIVGFDQFIFEQNNSTWFHFSYSSTRNRVSILSKPRGNKYFPGLIRLA